MSPTERMAGEKIRQQMRDEGVPEDICQREDLTYAEAYEAIEARREEAIGEAMGEPPQFHKGSTCSPAISEDGAIEVVGLSHRKKAVEQVFKAHQYSDGDAAAWAILEPDPQNKHDPNAVAVVVDGEQVGFLERDVAGEIHAGLAELLRSSGEFITTPMMFSRNRSGWIDAALHLDELQLEELLPEQRKEAPPMKAGTLLECPECGHKVSRTAVSCPGCGATLRSGGTSKGVAALLSFIIPGAGQMYQGRVLTGLLLFLLFITTIWFLIGILFWVIAVLDTLTYSPKSRAR